MTSWSSFVTPRHISRMFLLVAFSVIGSVLVSSCLTPKINFEDADDNPNASGGDMGFGGGGMEPEDFPHCFNDVKDENETDVDCGGGDCERCSESKSCKIEGDCKSKICDDRVCAEPNCEDRIQNGNESDIDCGGQCDPCDPGAKCLIRDDCEKPPKDDTSAATTFCTDGICVLNCAMNFGDCNQDAEDGCEVDIKSDLGNCGGCNQACELPNTTAVKCSSGECLIDFEEGGCKAPFLDINGDIAERDGCEVDSSSNVDHCGGESIACSDNNGTPSCKGGECEIECSGSHANCDEDARANGCEVNLSSSILACGSCDTACPIVAGQSAACSMVNESPQCLSIDCGDVNDCEAGEPCGACDDDQTCNDTLNTVDNCGGCGIACSATHATTACSPSNDTYSCAIDTCVDSDGSDFEDCNNDYEDGCETDVKTNLNHCGGCSNAGGQDCALIASDDTKHVAAIQCDADVGCKVTSCDDGFVDCDGNAQNGCEVNLNTDINRCGGCLAADPGFETFGGGVACENRDHTSKTCENGACIWECSGDWDDADDDKNGVAPSNGCESIPLVLVNAEKHWFAQNNGGGSLVMTFSHDLETAKASDSNRMVLVAAANQRNDNNALPEGITYGGVPMRMVESAYLGTGQSSSSLWVLYDANLGDAGTYEIVVNTGNNGWGSVYAEALEFRNVRQRTSPEVPPTGFVTEAEDCNPNNTIGSTVSMTVSAGSWLYGMAGSQTSSGAQAHPANNSLPGGSFTVELRDEIVAGANPQVVVSSARSGVLSAGEQEVWFEQGKCYETQLAVIEIEAFTTP